MTTSNRIPVLTPQGHLMLAPTDEARILPDNLRDRLESAFVRGAGHGLLELGIREVGTALPADFAYWRDFAGRYVTTLCTSAQLPTGATDPAAVSTIETPPAEILAELANVAPPMPGGEYLNADVLAALWEQIDTACRAELDDAKQTSASGAEGKSAAAYANHSEDRSELTRASIFDVFATPAVNAEGTRRLEHLDLNCNHAGLNFSDDFFTVLQ